MDTFKHLNVNTHSIDNAMSAVQKMEDQHLISLETITIDQLKLMYTETLQLLANKERDLILAAEIGQSLLNSNTDLKAALVEAEQSNPLRAAVSNRAQIAKSLDAYQITGNIDQPIATYENHINDLNTQIQTLNTQLLQVCQTHQTELKSLTKEYDREKTRADLLDQNLSELMLEKKRAVHENIQLKVQLSQGSLDEPDRLYDDLIAMREERDLLQASKTQLTQQLDLVMNSNTNLELQVQSLTDHLAEYTDLQHSHQLQARQLTELRELVEDLRSHLNRLTHQDDQHHQHHQHHESGVRSLLQSFSFSAPSVEGQDTLGPNTSSLISELESVWLKEHNANEQRPSSGVAGLLETFRPCPKCGTSRVSPSTPTLSSTSYVSPSFPSTPSTISPTPFTNPNYIGFSQLTARLNRTKQLPDTLQNRPMYASCPSDLDALSQAGSNVQTPTNATVSICLTSSKRTLATVRNQSSQCVFQPISDSDSVYHSTFEIRSTFQLVYYSTFNLVHAGIHFYLTLFVVFVWARFRPYTERVVFRVANSVS